MNDRLPIILLFIAGIVTLWCVPHVYSMVMGRGWSGAKNLEDKDE